MAVCHFWPCNCLQYTISQHRTMSKNALDPSLPKLHAHLQSLSVKGSVHQLLVMVSAEGFLLSFFCFRLSLLFAFIFLSLGSVSLCLPHCFSVSFFYTFNYCHHIYLFFPVFLLSCILFFCSHDAVCLFFVFFNIIFLNIWHPFVSSR